VKTQVGIVLACKDEQEMDLAQKWITDMGLQQVSYSRTQL